MSSYMIWSDVVVQQLVQKFEGTVIYKIILVFILASGEVYNALGLVRHDRHNRLLVHLEVFCGALFPYQQHHH